MFISKKLHNKILKAKEREIADLKLKVEQRDIMLKDYQEEHEILLNNVSELKSKIADLENNIEFLTNNSKSKIIKELVRDHQSKN